MCVWWQREAAEIVRTIGQAFDVCHRPSDRDMFHHVSQSLHSELFVCCR